MQGSARKDVVFGAARVYTATVPGPKWKSWLRAVQHPVAFVFDGRCAGAGRVGAGFGFGKRPAAEPLADGKFGDVFAALFFASVKIDVACAQRRMSRHDQGYGRVDPSQFLDDDSLVNVPHPGTGERLGKNRPERAKMPQLPGQFLGNLLLFIPFPDVGFDLSFGELTHRPAQVVLFTGRIEVHVASGHAEAPPVSHQTTGCTWLPLSIVMCKRSGMFPRRENFSLFLPDRRLSYPAPAAATVFLVK